MIQGQIEGGRISGRNPRAELRRRIARRIKGPIIIISILIFICIQGEANKLIMADESDTDIELDTLTPLEHEYASGGVSEYEETVCTWDDYEEPPTLSPPHTMDVPSVRRPLRSLMTSANVVSARRPPSLPLKMAERGKLYIVTVGA